MATAALKRTPLYEAHQAAGAKLVPFAGWEMPVSYEGVRQEHVAVRTSCGVFDVSHMGEVETSGPGALDLLQRLLSNDVSKLEVGGAQYSVLCREDGGILDDLFTYRLGDDRYLIVTNAANHDTDFAWFADHAGEFDADVIDASTATRCWPSRGPTRAASWRASPRRSCPLACIPPSWTSPARPALVCGTGYTGEDGVELLPPADAATRVWAELLDAGCDAAASARATPCGSRSVSTCTATTWTRAQPDRGGPRLVLQGGDGIHRLRGRRRALVRAAPSRSWRRS